MNQAAIPMYYLGIDGGGSKCKARLHTYVPNYTDSKFIASAIAGPANPFQNFTRSCQSIVEAAQLALQAAGLPQVPLSQLVVGAGLAGVNIPRCYQQMSEWEHPFAALHLTTDIHIASLGAHAGEDGAVIVAGTGSVGYCAFGDKQILLGAHGFPFGDKGSGAWVGLEAMKAVLLALDGLGPDTLMVTAVEQKLAVKGLGIIDAMSAASQRDYGTLAPLVMDAAEAGDDVAIAIVREGAEYLMRMARRLLKEGDGKPQVCLLGGLAPRMQNWFDDELRACIVGAEGQPDEGAVRYAIQQQLLAQA